MPEYYNIIILFAAGLLAGFINVMAGGGSTITLPILIFMGLDGATANGTNRVAILLQNASAIKSFRDTKFSNFKLSLKLALLTLPGGVLGPLLAVNMSNETFKLLLGVIMIGVVISMVLPKKKIETVTEEKITPVTAIALFAVGFYGGFIQVGVGFLLMSSLHYLMKIDLIRVNMHKVFIVFFYTLPALLIFVISGKVNWYLGLSLAAGNMTGGWWAAKMQVKRGENIVKYALIIAVVIMSAKLIGLF